MKLTIRDLELGYAGSPVITGLHLDIPSKGRVALVGRNGVGKTTLMRGIVGELRARRGSILLDGKEIVTTRSHIRARAGIGYVPQGRRVFAKLSVHDNVRVAAYATNRKHYRQRVESAFDQFPTLYDVRSRPAGQLSGGQQQLLALARALATEPSILFLDEPTEGIQPSIVQDMVGDLNLLNETRGITVVVVEQNLEFAGQVADTVHVMEGGTIAQTLPAGQLLGNKSLHGEYLGL